MKRIELSRGEFAMVDDNDYDDLSQFKWCLAPDRNTSYAQKSFRLGGKSSTISMHRYLLKSPLGIVDHIDGNGLNNQRSNLRVVDARQNQWNSKKQKGCSSSFKGVSWNKHAKKWKVSFGPSKSRMCLGYCDSEIEAALIYNVAASFEHREYAKLNQIP